MGAGAGGARISAGGSLRGMRGWKRTVGREEGVWAPGGPGSSSRWVAGAGSGRERCRSSALELAPRARGTSGGFPHTRGCAGVTGCALGASPPGIVWLR